jgi:hypothetical protein
MPYQVAFAVEQSAALCIISELQPPLAMHWRLILQNVATLPFRQVFDGHGMGCRVNMVAAWNGEISADVAFYFERPIVLAPAKGALFMGDYGDCHCWVFTCEAFLDIIRSINNIGIMRGSCIGGAAKRRKRISDCVYLLTWGTDKTLWRSGRKAQFAGHLSGHSAWGGPTKHIVSI